MLRAGKPDLGRNEQFEFINTKAEEFTNAGDPVVSVDIRKKESFPVPEPGRVSPCGIYAVSGDTGFVNLGTGCDTAELAAESISRWWETVGKNTFPDRRLMVTCDRGENSGCRLKLWKYQLAQFAERTRLEIHVSHFPAGHVKMEQG